MVCAENLGLAIDIYHVWWDAKLEETLKSTDVPILGFHINDWLEVFKDMLLDRGIWEMVLRTFEIFAGLSSQQAI